MTTAAQDDLSWNPYSPSTSQAWDLGKVAHLHRRAGFGATWGELQRDLADGPDQAVDRLLNAPPDSAEELEIYEGLRAGIRRNTADSDERLQAYWVNRILFGKNPLRQKMTLFWHGHFATARSGNALMVGQNETLRRHALGNFRELVNAIVIDPAMQIWLNGVDSAKARPNENLGRELLELFTLGEGNYTEADVKSAARALTGWSLPDPGSAETTTMSSGTSLRFKKRDFDDGPKTFLGQTGPWGAEDVVRICMAQPAVAEFISRKLYRFLVADVAEPPAKLIAELAGEFRQNDYSIRHIIEIVLRSEHFYSNCRQKVASPAELSIGLVRKLGIPRSKVRLLPIAEACRRQGQHLFYPPNVAGWKGGRCWITTSNLLHRSNWLTDVIWGNEKTGVSPFDPIAWCEENDILRNECFDALVDLLVQRDVSPVAMKLARASATPPDIVGLRKAMELLVQCPEFQLV